MLDKLLEVFQYKTSESVKSMLASLLKISKNGFAYILILLCRGWLI